MRTSYKIAAFFGIPVELHISFLLLFLFILFSATVAYMRGFPWALALGSVVGIVMIFSLVVLHELSHSLVGRHYGLKISKIVLLPIGGVANMEEYPEDAKKEFLISFSGPAVNLALAIFTALLLYVFGLAESISPFFSMGIGSFADLLVIFFKVNLILGLFNLFVPALPMDGGRILRSLLSFQMGYRRATQVSAEVAKVIAIFMAFVGITFNPWLIIIALFVYIGASQEGEYASWSNLLAGVKVEDIMSREMVTVPAQMSLDELFEVVFRYRYMGYPVEEDGEIVGVISFSDISKVPRDKLEEYKVKDVMSRKLITIDAQEDAIKAMLKMPKKGVKRLLVVKGGDVVGILSRTDLTRAIELQRLLE